jgi:ribosomal protein S7
MTESDRTDDCGVENNEAEMRAEILERLIVTIMYLRAYANCARSSAVPLLSAALAIIEQERDSLKHENIHFHS